STVFAGSGWLFGTRQHTGSEARTDSKPVARVAISRDLDAPPICLRVQAERYSQAIPVARALQAVFATTPVGSRNDATAFQSPPVAKAAKRSGVRVPFLEVTSEVFRSRRLLDPARRAPWHARPPAIDRRHPRRLGRNRPTRPGRRHVRDELRRTRDQRRRT